MPCTSAVRARGSTSSTRWKAATSSRGPPRSRPNRNRLDVDFASRTGAPGGRDSYRRRSASTARVCESYGGSADRVRTLSTTVRYRLSIAPTAVRQYSEQLQQIGRASCMERGESLGDDERGGR